jgi:hypothetical protein
MASQLREYQFASRPKDPALAPELELLARIMDSAFRIPGLGIRFGLDAIIGLIPGLGDALTSLVSLYILSAAHRLGVPRVTLLRMAANIAIDTVLGALPLVGDAFDVYWKANEKNVALLRRHLSTTPDERRLARHGDRLFVVVLVAGLVALLAGSMALVYLIVTGLARLI